MSVFADLILLEIVGVVLFVNADRFKGALEYIWRVGHV